MTTNADLIADARALDAEATPGPWFYFISEPGGFERGAKPAGIYPHDDPNDDEAIAFLRTAEQDDTDAAFIARTRTLLPQLADALVALHVDVRKWAIREAHSEDGKAKVCGVCMHSWPANLSDEYHAEDCPARPMEPGT